MNSEKSFLARLLEPLRQRIALMVRRAVISLVKDENPVQTVQLKMFTGECRSGVERIQEYGLSTVPPAGAQAVAVCVDGECGHELVTATDDRRYRPRNLPDGSVMLYTKANRKDGADTEHHWFLDPETRIISGRAKTLIIDADETIEIRTKDGKNFLRIGVGYGVRLTEGGGLEEGGSDIRMKDGKIWRYAARELITRTPEDWKEEPPSRTGGTRGPTMPE